MSERVRSSIIIPSFQSQATIRACLTAVLSQQFDGAFEVIVADSGTDATSDLIEREFPSVRVLKSKARLDPALGRNWGADAARGTVLAFIDSDCVPAPDWLARLSATLETGGYDGVGGAIRNPEGANATSWAGYFCEFREFLPGGSAVDATNLTLGNAAYRRDVFRRAGGLPGGYFPQEDQVFHSRLIAAGARLRYDPSIVVEHMHRTDISAFLTHQTRIGAANARVVRTLGLQGAGIASRQWLAASLVPFLATWRFARTAAACWNAERCLMVRRPVVTALCWLGMFAWAIGFAQPAVEAAPPVSAHR